MPQDFETLNKQIAAFIIVSGAFAAPVFADGGLNGTGAVPSSVQIQDIVVRYAGPGMGSIPTPTVAPQTPVSPTPPMVVKYAGPGVGGEFPTPTIAPDTPSSPTPPMVVKYAGPGIGGEFPTPTVSHTSSRTNELKQADNTESLRVINSADSVTADNREEEHVYGEVKVAPGRFRFW